MKQEIITKQDVKNLGLRIITYFKPKKAFDITIAPQKNLKIHFRDKTEKVDCNITKPQRKYNHFEWIRKEAERIDADPDRIIYIVKNEKGHRALAAN